VVDSVLTMSPGRIVLQDSAVGPLANQDLSSAYLGESDSVGE
jgi:hypothetical protein